MADNTTRVKTDVVRLSFAHIFEPVSVNGGDPKYSASLIIPKDDMKTIAAIQQAIKAAYDTGKSKFGANPPPLAKLKTPLRDGDEERPEDEAYANAMFVNANSNTAPGIVDLARKPITDSNVVYSGCFVRAMINFYAFNKNGNRGIAAGLGNIQKVKDGEPLGGRTRAEDDFSDDFVGDSSDEDFLS
jgi:hypothetical protein